MKITMKLLSDVIFGNGSSVPGAEDISVLHDSYGFPYYRGTTFKGIFREALALYLSWQNKSQEDIDKELDSMLGKSGDNEFSDKIVFSDFVLSDNVKNTILSEDNVTPERVLDSLTNLRTFTKISEDDSQTVERKSLRIARCVNQGLYFYAEVTTMSDEQDKLIKEVLPMIKWIGSMRNRGFGKVSLKAE